MGFFKSVTRVFKKAVPALATGGLSLVAPKSIQTQLGNLFVPTSPGALAKIGTIAAPQLAPLTLAGGNMGFNVGAFLGGVSKAFSGSSISGIQGVGQIAGAFAPAFSMPQQVAQNPDYGGGQIYTVADVPAKREPALTRDIFELGSQILGKLGLPTPASQSKFIAVLKRALSALSVIAKRTPAGGLVSTLVTLGLTEVAALKVASWYQKKKKRRRMNPANSRALRRAARRIHSFHRLCQHTDVLKTRHHRAPVRYGRTICGKCGKGSCRGC